MSLKVVPTKNDCGPKRPIDVRFLEWTRDFEKLLNDRVGIRLFAEFLKKEFSYENLKFWKLCQRYKRLTIKNELKREAMSIYENHIRVDALEPVNIDSYARFVVEEALKDPTPQLFALPEKQIFDLMKFDCYKRFLKSDFSNNKIESVFKDRNLDKNNRYEATESEKEPLTSCHSLIAPKKHKIPELKQIKDKQINKKLQQNIFYHKKNLIIKSHQNKLYNRRSNLTRHERIKRLTRVLSETKNLNRRTDSYYRSSHSDGDKYHILKVIFPDGSREKVSLTQSEKIGQTLQKLLNQKKLKYTAFDVFVTGSENQLDQNINALKLSCNEIRIEQRIVFELNFPNGLIISIKAKPNRLCGNLFHFLLNKYGYNSDDYVILFAYSSKLVVPDMAIILIDNQSLVVKSKEDLNKFRSHENINDMKKVQVDHGIDIQITIINRPISSRKNIETNNDNNEFLEKESYSAIKNAKHEKSSNLKECVDYINFSDISFSDDSKSDAFLSDILRSSQMMPINQSTFSLSPKLILTAQKCDSVKTGCDCDPLVEQNEKSRRGTKLNEINLPEIERAKSTLNVNYDQNLKKMQFNSNESEARHDFTLITQKTSHISELSDNKIKQKALSTNQSNVNYKPMQTLAKFHKTSSERLPVLESKTSQTEQPTRPKFSLNKVNVKNNNHNNLQN